MKLSTTPRALHTWLPHSHGRSHELRAMSECTTKTTGSEEQETNVAAQCTACGDEHPLGDRRLDANSTTTVCPHCGSTQYTSVCYGGQIVKSVDERIADVVSGVSGIGSETQANIINAFDLYVEFESAGVTDLRKIEGVGKTTAERIIETRP